MVRPQALLLDFGGVIADGPENPQWIVAVTEEIEKLLAASGVAPVPRPVIAGALGTDDRSAVINEFWREPAPTQPAHESFWRQLAAGWPPPAVAVVAAHGELLSRRFMEAKHAGGWQLRPGMAELLAEAQQRRLPVAVVSNTLHGRPHREFLARVGVADHLTDQFYSDEQGLRKPNPAFAARAVEAVGVAAAGCWFVGDTLSRDVLVARRAGLGAAVLMRSLRREPPPHPDGVAPDATVADPVALHELLARHW